jgi:hypothetical protein
MLADLRDWLKRLGLSEAQVIPFYNKIVEENGLAARLLTNQIGHVLPLSTRFEMKLSPLVGALHRVESPEYAEWLLNQLEPTPEELSDLLNKAKDALPNLRQHFLVAAKGGPRYRHGRRPKKLDNPETHEQIRAKIKARRDAGTTLGSIFKRVAREYGVSSSKIKRIWEEKLKEKTGNDAGKT